MMDVTEQAKRSDALYYSGNDGINRRWLCDKVASLEATLEMCDSDARDHLRDFTAETKNLQDRCDGLAHLVQDMLMTINNAARGFSVHPKAYRDYYSRAKKLKVKVD